MRIRARSPLVFFLVAGATYALAAQQPRDNRARTREGTATLSGRVVTRDGDGRPLRKTIVMLRSDDGRMQRTAITDDAGAFTFDALPAGRYGVDARLRTASGSTISSSGCRAAPC
jgi:protocatechuate 3,4-dioxygenase beta subunit